jgi:hypothetical protein
MVNAIAASASKRGKVFMPSGIYKFASTLVIPDGVHIYWEGSGTTHDTIISPSTLSQGYGITKIVMNSTTLDCFRDSSVGSTYNNFDIQNTSTTIPTAGAAINAIGTMFAASNMSIKSFFYGIEQQNTVNPTIYNVNFRDNVQYGYYSFNTWNPDIGDDALISCQFANYFRRTVAQVFKRGSGGLKISTCKFNAGGQMIGDCIRDSVPTSASNTTDMLITNCSFENYVGFAVNVYVGSGASMSSIVITGNEISSFQSGSGINLINAGGGAVLTRVVITGNMIGNCTTGIIATSVDHLIISGNDNTSTTQQTLTSCTNVFYDRIPVFDDIWSVVKNTNGAILVPITNANGGTSTAAGIQMTAGANSGYIYKASSNYATTNIQNTLLLQDAVNIGLLNNGALTLKSFSNNNINIGVSGTDYATAQVQIQNTTKPQVALHYDASNYTTEQTNSSGNYTITPTGGTTTISSNLTLPVAKVLTITEGSNGRVGQVALIAGTKAITITGLTTSSRGFVQLVSQGGTVTTTVGYEVVCTSNTLTISAVTSAGSNALNNLDTSTLNYFVIN